MAKKTHRENPPQPEDQHPLPPPEPPAAAEDAAFAELMEDALTLDDDAVPPPAPSSAVDLGQHAKDPHSAAGTPASASSFPWEDLVREPAGSSGAPPPPPAFDSPSDAGVLRHAAEDEEALPFDAAAASVESSRVDLSDAGNLGDFSASAPPPIPAPGDSGVFIAEAVPDAGADMDAAAEVISLDSAVDLGSSGVEVIEGEASSVDLGGASPAARDAAADSSGVDLGLAGASLLDSSSGIELEGAVVLDDDVPTSSVEYAAGPALLDSPSGLEGLPEESSQSDVFVGADVPPADAPVSAGLSGIDLGEEAVEPATSLDSTSGMDLSGPAVTTEDDFAAVFPEQLTADDPAGTSAVNLDAPLAGPGSARDLIAEAVESGVGLGHSADGPSAAEIDDDIFASAAVPSEGDSAVDLGASGVMEEEPAAAVVEGEEDLETTREWSAAGAPEADEFEAADALGAGAVEEIAAGEAVTFEDEAAVEPPSVVLEDEGVEGVKIAVDEEGAAAVAESAEAVEEEEAVGAGSGRRQPKPKYGRRWIGGTLVGAVLGSAACVAALVYLPREQIADWRQKGRAIVGADADSTRGQQASPGTSAASLTEKVRNGDFTAEPPPLKENNNDELATRGEFLWLQYLQRTDPKKYNLTDPAVSRALTDLEKAGTAKADYWRGNILETMGKFDGARTIYRQGLQKYGTDAGLKTMFEGALDRLDVRAADKGSSAATSRLPGRLDTASLALLLIGLQPPPPPPMGQPPKGAPPVPQEVPEAGFSFWKAVKLAQGQKYAEAAKALADARKHHVARRLEQLRKAQNPLSDPTEEIFLRTCDEMIAYWQLQDRLRAGGYLNLTTRKNPLKAFDNVLADLKKAAADNDALKKDAATLKEEKKAAETRVATLETDLKKSKKETSDALTEVADRENKLKKAAADLKAETVKLAAATVRADQLNGEKKDLEKIIAHVGDKLALKDFDPKAGKAILFSKLDDVLNIARTNDPMGRLMANIKEVQHLNGVLGQRWTPEAMLSYWMPLLADRDQKGLTAAAVRDVERVRADTAAPASARSQALAVEGLALRNRGDFGRARATLAAALKGDAPDGATWRTVAREALKELSDPGAYYLPRAEDLRARHQYAGAVAVLDEGLKVFPEANGRLLVLRSLVRLDAALGSAAGGLKADAPGIKEAQADAAAAIEAGAAGAGHYAAGRIAEELGQREAATASYRKAVAAAPAASVEAAQYRAALARMLLPGAPDEDRRGGRVGPRRLQRLPTVEELLLLAVVGVQPPPPEEVAAEEATRLADEILARKDIDTLPLLKAQALAVKGLYTQSLNSYVAGLRPHLSRELYAGLKRIVENHPMQRRPDRSRVPHPFQAQKHYAAGLSRFFERDYATAEKEFAKAIENFDLDARYHYYLGLARLQQRKRGPAEDFDQAARLELEGRPARDAVDASLERIQGRPRRLINEARNRIR